MEKRTVGGGDVYLMEEGTISQGHTPDGRGDNITRTHLMEEGTISQGHTPDGRGDNITRTHT